jgi:hypothetical protein
MPCITLSPLASPGPFDAYSTALYLSVQRRLPRPCWLHRLLFRRDTIPGPIPSIYMIHNIFRLFLMMFPAAQVAHPVSSVSNGPVQAAFGHCALLSSTAA